ncbi:hypothetical protein HLB23_15985 [Nocardia uniformis]|uniref:TIGR02611 family protein n=1 Tax=Nocardia uniformis TaxID=53432 RepID=A0A849BYI2_9NOCA|nr:PGPGW domain-containing protein [Nocardia uniformis]NNH71344.1 hypothetical protein [Nocardia uniformis]
MTPLDTEPNEATAQRVVARRERHRRRSLIVRIPVALAGALLGIVGVPLLLIPEFGVPAVLLSLRLLALEFAWATRAQSWIERKYSAFRRWFAERSMTFKVGVTLAVLAVVVLAVLEFVR